MCERGGFVYGNGRPDTTWFERRAGLVAERCSRTGKARRRRTAGYAASMLIDLLRRRQTEAREATELLRGMPGALDDALEGSAQARRGESTGLDAL